MNVRWAQAELLLPSDRGDYLDSGKMRARGKLLGMNSLSFFEASGPFAVIPWILDRMWIRGKFFA